MRYFFAVLALVTASCSSYEGTSADVVIVALVREVDGSISRREVYVPASVAFEREAEIAREPGVVAAGRSGSRRTHSDPLLKDQWGSARLSYERIGELPAPAGVIVAVLDTGVDASHPDLSGRVLRGFDAVSGSAGADSDPNGHGTHVAGIIAAVAGNGIGVAGFASGVSILPVRVLGTNGYGDDADLATGIIWAVDNGADVINMSVGGAEDMSLLRSAVEYASSRGVLLVASAGNDALWGNAPSFPAALPEVIAVGATTQRDGRAMFSNTGSYLELSAPGSSIVSTWPGGRYIYSSGTSMAAPFVSAAAALVLFATGLRGELLRSELRSSALDVGPPGRDDEFGFGIIDPFRASGLAGIASSPPEFSLPGILPGLPDLPTFDLPPLPDPSELFARLPELPDFSKMLPELPELPSYGLPEFPDPGAPSAGDPGFPYVEGPGVPARAEVGLGARWEAGLVLVELSGAAALVAYRRVSWVAYSGPGVSLGSGEVRLDATGSGSFTAPEGWGRVELSYPGSLTTLSAGIDIRR